MNPSPALRLPDLPFRKSTLPNGLDVITLRTGILPIVSANLWYHVGSKNEERTQRGFAHLFEHLMFEGSEHYPGDYFKPLQRLGASVNGSTSSDRTNYFSDLPSSYLELALAMESDRMANLLPALTDEKVRIQKDVVKNEYRQNYANRPYGRVGRLIAEAMYPPSHPYSWLTIGVMEDVERASREEIDGFFRRFYVPANASLAIVGDIDQDQALELADRYFGSIPGGTRSLPVHVPVGTHAGGQVEIEIREPVELDRLYLCWASVPQFSEHDASLVILGDVLSRGRSSRLYENLVVRDEICQDVNAHQAGREIAGSFSAIATLRPGQRIEEAQSRILAEIESIAEHGPNDDELQRVKNSRLAGFVFALDNVGGFGGVSDRLNAYNVYLHDPSRITSDFQRYQNVSAHDVREAARRLMGRAVDQDHAPRRVTLKVLGRKPSDQASVDRKIRPSPSRVSTFQAPHPEVRMLKCGAPLWVLPRRDLPIVAATVVVAAGASSHGAEQGGLASLTSNVMDEGTATRTSHQIAVEVESLGTSLSSTSGWDGSYVSFQCLSPHLKKSLELGLDVFLRPTFPEPDFRRVADQTLAGLKADRDNADSRAYRGLLKAIYPIGHAYGIPASGDESTVATLTRADLAEFHRTRYMPDRAAVVVAGDVDPDLLQDQIDMMLAGWTGTSEEPRSDVAAVHGVRPRILLLHRPGASQAAVRVGHPGIARQDPDHDALMLFNQILGGQFTSRLNARLREEKGFTYGIRSHFDTRTAPGPFSISSSLQSDRIAEALQDIRDEVMALLDHRPSSETELDDARRALIEGQARHFETPSALVSRYAGLFLYGLPMDEHARLPERLLAITNDGLIEAARKHIRVESLTFVVVADASSVASSLSTLTWADLEMIS